jgi:hypothetical protein
MLRTCGPARPTTRCCRSNTTSGRCTTLTRSHTDLAIAGEKARIELCLIGVADVPLESLRRLLAPRRSQCTAFLASLPQVAVESFIDTAMSVER